MAYAAAVSLMQILQKIMDDPDAHSVLHEKQEIESLQEKVSFLVDFLEDYSVCTDKVVKDLEIKIRDAAYEAEDIIESYISTSILSDFGESYICTSSFSDFDGECYISISNSLEVFPTFCRDLDRVIEQTHSIRQEAIDIKCMLELDSNDIVHQRKALPVGTSRLTSSTVGLVEDSMKVKDWLTSSSSKREVISIYGMGGIGKTTFARSLFDESLILYHFDSRAWVTVSQDYRIDEIIEGLLASVNEFDPEMRNGSSGEPAERLYKSLKGRRYLIVMDDVWDTKLWDAVKRLFPDDNNGSRIVLTTRLASVGVHAASLDRLHDMSFLSSNESWKLFCETAFRGQCCPPDLEEIGGEIVRNCKGLPLSIVVVGGLLAMNKTARYWTNIATTMNSILATDGSQCSTIFSLSYSHLPAHLKPCFLYFATFPEDYNIQRSKIIKLWVAEGFIKQNDSKSLEDSAEEYLGDLVNRSLIMVLKLGGDGKVKTYRIHDLLRDFCIKEAQNERLLHVISGYTPNHPKGIRSERRISIQRFTPVKSIKYIFNSDGPTLATRSLLSYYYSADIIISEHNFGLLRVLGMRDGKRFFAFPMVVVRLMHLRYLSLSCLSATVPATISLIRGLQTLVLDIWSPVFRLCLPLQVWSMPHLRHVQITHGHKWHINFSTGGCRLLDPPNSNFVILANLQTLSTIINFRFTDEIIKRIPKLKKLKVDYEVTSEDWSQFHLSNIVRLNELESLHIKSSSKIAFPPNFKFPAALKKLTFSGGRLRPDDLTMVGSLPNLQVLILSYAFCKGEVWEPNEGEFCELKFLKLFNCSDLVHWKADGSHFPSLKCLNISYCNGLEEIPMEIGNIQTLEMIELVGASPSAVASARLILDEQRSFGNDLLQVHIIERKS